MHISEHHATPKYNFTVLQVYTPTTNTEEAEQLYDELQDLLN